MGSRRQSHRAAWVTDVDLADLPPALIVPAGPDGRTYSRARVLVRLQGEPLGMLNVGVVKGEVDPGALAVLALDAFGPAVAQRLGPQWRPGAGSSVPPLSAELAAIEGDDLPGVSVVVGTRDRPDHVVACVAGVLKQSYSGPYEVIVVDNAPSSDATGTAIDDHFGSDDRVRYVRLEEPGLSRARNVGLSLASHELTAFLSDDIQVDPVWLRAVVRGFRRHDNVVAVFGYCPPLYLDSEAQLMFESTMAWGWRGGFEPLLLGYDRSDRLSPYRVIAGTGANLSYLTEYLRSRGGFDESLGPGTLARGGEDLDTPVRTLLDGRRIAYEPAAVGWHADRYDDRQFWSHMYTYGLGLTAFLASHLADRRTRWGLVRRAPFGAIHFFKPAILPDSDDRLDGSRLRIGYGLANVAGRLVGPVALIRSRRALAARTRAEHTIDDHIDDDEERQ